MKKGFIVSAVKTIVKINCVIAAVNYIFDSLDRGFRRKKDDIEGGRFYNWRQGRIFYHKRGQGAPVVLIHGLNPKDSGEELMTLSRALSEKHTVYAIDLLGFGLSEKPWITYTNYMYVQLISDFIKDEIGKQADIVALGGSGLIALQTKKLHPELIGKTALIDPVRKESFTLSGKMGGTVRKVLNMPMYGTFFYNILSLACNGPYSKETRYVFTSKLGGCLTESITGYENLLGPGTEIFERSEKKVTYREIGAALQ
ncbi:MAG: alpha/beta fold hydrolase [Parasporobacterium sp.]|nr:alpha/beta fold hydrolase [Parasporobacterium sp.]